MNISSAVKTVLCYGDSNTHGQIDTELPLILKLYPAYIQSVLAKYDMG